MNNKLTEEKIKGNKIVKNIGLNESEKYLANLCNKTFLSLWSFPDVYRKEGKQLCDLFVLFEDHILIFSNKSCEYPGTSNDSLNWNRWFKRAIRKSADSLWGSERWIRQHPDKIFLDKKCNDKFPFNINPQKIKIHLILVARGSSDACKKYFNGGSGSLIITNNLRGLSEQKELFTIGDLDPQKTFIHVLDDTTLNIIMNTLDTVSDFVHYIYKKEKLFRSNRTIYAAGEEDLLPYYLGDMKGEEHDFNFPEDGDIVLVEGAWEKFCDNPQRKAQIKENKISYFWDDLIEHFNRHALNETQYISSIQGIQGAEKIMKFFASENRYRRRILSKELYDLMKATPKNILTRRLSVPRNEERIFYAFMMFPKKNDISEKEYRKLRIRYLEAYCMAVKVFYPKAKDIIGFATESGLMSLKNKSEDAMYFDGREWDEKKQKKAEWLRKELKILINPKQKIMYDPEFPDVSDK